MKFMYHMEEGQIDFCWFGMDLLQKTINIAHITLGYIDDQ